MSVLIKQLKKEEKKHLVCTISVCKHACQSISESHYGYKFISNSQVDDKTMDKLLVRAKVQPKTFHLTRRNYLKSQQKESYNN